MKNLLVVFVLMLSTTLGLAQNVVNDATKKKLDNATKKELDNTLFAIGTEDETVSEAAKKTMQHCAFMTTDLSEHHPNQYQTSIMKTTCSLTKDRLQHAASLIDVELIRLDMVLLFNAVQGEMMSNELRGRKN